jgi:trehalose 6-phosphate phosphatase
VTVLDPALTAALDELARRRPLLLASDYDGVLARLRDDPATAVLEPGIADLLDRLVAVEGVTVALVSGRGVEDLRRTSGLTGPFRWVGSHGAEFDGPPAAELTTRRDALAAALTPLVDAVPGARLEV